MSSIVNIAMGTFREITRNKVFYVAIAFCIAIVAVGSLYKTVSLGEEFSLMRNSGLACIQVLGVLIAVFVTGSTITREMDTKAIQVLLTKPVSKGEFLLGKYFGSLLVVFYNVALMSAGLLFILLLKTHMFNFGLIKAILPMCFEFAVIAAVTVLFSILFKGVAGPIFALVIFAIGHITQLLPYAIQTAHNFLIKAVMWLFYYILPNLSHFDLKNEAVRGLTVPCSLMGGIFLYGVLYITIILTISMLIFGKKETALT